LHGIRSGRYPDSGSAGRTCRARWPLGAGFALWPLRADFTFWPRRACHASGACRTLGTDFTPWSLHAGRARGACRPLGTDFTLWPLHAGRACWTLGTDFALGALGADLALWPLSTSWPLRANGSRWPDCALQSLCSLRSWWPRRSSWTLCPGLAAATRENERGHDERNAQQLSHWGLPAQSKRLPRTNSPGQASNAGALAGYERGIQTGMDRR
jgi:hypothetical protein